MCNQTFILRFLPNNLIGATTKPFRSQNNKIKNASGLANCHKIEYLSLGRNDIDSIDNDEYGIGNQLRHLTSLRNLNLTDNPITITEGYVSKISSYLPSLIYLDNEKITLKTF